MLLSGHRFSPPGVVPFPLALDKIGPALGLFKDELNGQTIKEVKNITKGRSGIYCWYCTVTGKFYIGSAKDL
jgi:hypothetical protein